MFMGHALDRKKRKRSIKHRGGAEQKKKNHIKKGR